MPPLCRPNLFISISVVLLIGHPQHWPAPPSLLILSAATAEHVEMVIKNDVTGREGVKQPPTFAEQEQHHSLLPSEIERIQLPKWHWNTTLLMSAVNRWGYLLQIC